MTTRKLHDAAIDRVRAIADKRIEGVRRDIEHAKRSGISRDREEALNWAQVSGISLADIIIVLNLAEQALAALEQD